MTAAAPRAHSRGRAGARLAGLADMAFALGRGLALVLSLMALQSVPAWAQATPGAASTLTVGAGDTATALAQKLRPEAATLEQTLVAIWRANPRAFANGNLNLLLQGASLQVPSEAEILHTPAPQARALVLEQVENFQAFARQQGASAATPAGSTQAATPDAAAWARALAEAQALKDALERQSRDTQARLAQLEKNIQALQALTASPGALAGAPASSATASQSAASNTQPQAAASEVLAVSPTAAASEADVTLANLAASAASAAETSAHSSAASTPIALTRLANLERPTLLWSAAGAVLVLMLLWTLLHQRRQAHTQARTQAQAEAAARIEIPPQMASIDLNLGGPLSPQREDPRP